MIAGALSKSQKKKINKKLKEIQEGAKEAKDNEFYDALTKVSKQAKSIVR